MKKVDLTGRKFGHLTALRDVGTKQGNRLWLCICDRDDNEIIVPASDLTKNHTTSCGRCPNDAVSDSKVTIIFMESKDAPYLCAIDTKDYPLVKPYHWHVTKSKRSRTFYAATNVLKPDGSRTNVMMHRLLLPEAKEIDHANFNGLDNRRENLRPATRSQQNAHMRKREGTSSKFIGVCWREDRHKFTANISINKKCIHLGLFDSEIEAAKRYDEAAKKHHGEFAVLNFPASEK